jgi:hypothetical protein
MSTCTTSQQLNSGPNLSTPYKSTYQEARKTVNTRGPTLSLGALFAAPSDPLPSGASKSAYCQEASKTVNNTVSALSLLCLGEVYEASPDPLPSGASFLLEIHSRRENAAAPSQKMTRKEREYLETYAHPSSIENYAHPSLKRTSTDVGSPTKSPLPPPQKMSKKDRASLLQEALDLLSED